MKKRTSLFIIGLTFMLILGYAQAGFAASTVTVSPAGDGVFTLQGAAMESAAAMDITITYDASSLANPRVQQGGLISGALMAVNSNVLGTVRMAIIRTTPIQGSGVIATLTFDRMGGSGGKITGLGARLSDLNGKPLPALAQVVNSPDAEAAASGTGAQEEQQQGASASSGTSADPQATGSPMIGVVVPQAGGGADVSSGITATMEQTGQADMYGQDAGQAQGGVDIALKDAREALPLSKSPQKKIHSHKSVLERFREHAGERTEKALISLFEQDGAIGFRQEPSVVIADGKTAVKVVFITDPGEKSASDLAVMGASLTSLKRDPDYTNTWVAELKPAKNAFEANMTVSLEKLAIMFPLTVAPLRNIDLDKSGKVTEADFVLFLKNPGTSKAPAFDLNNDGKRDYLDEYIFTANYLVARGIR